MDLAELSDLGTESFAVFKQKLEEEFSKDVEAKEPNSTSEVKQLKYQLRQANSFNVNLQNKMKTCEDKYRKQFNDRLLRIEAQHGKKLLEYEETIQKIINRNRQLQDRLDEK
ncbi:hypothetical protein BGZ46_005229, partial [Entomortierella lignicola]